MTDPIFSGLLLTHIHGLLPTGSRVICNPAPTDTDCDIAVLTKGLEAFDFQARADGWVPPDFEQRFDQAYNKLESFKTYRKGEVNLIVTDSKDFFHRFDVATHAARQINLLNKRDRITLFHAVLYSNKWAS